MRILAVAPQPFFRARGTPFSVLHRIRALVKLGHSVELVTYPFGDDPELDGLVIHRAARVPGVRDVEIGPSVAKLLLDGPLLAKAYRLAKSGRFDLLHTHEEAAYAGAWIAKATGLPHLYDMHSSLPQQFANFDRFHWPPVVTAFRWLERRTLGHADGVIAICPDLHDHVRSIGFRGPLAMIENSLDFEPPDISKTDLRELRTCLGVGDAPVVVYTGTFAPYQGMDLLIRAAPRVARAVPAVRFVSVGGTPDQVETLRTSVAEHGVEDRFTLLPRVEPSEVFRYHALADLLVTCRTRGTNTPLKLYQYLRAGRPIVATAIHSHTQVLDGGCAELVEPSPAGIARGLVRVLLDDDRASELARGASAVAEERYTEATYLHKLRDILADLPIGAARERQAA